MPVSHPPSDVTTSPEGPIGVYIHWPFCQAICPYCDFNVHLPRQVDDARWRAALVAELDHFAAGIGRRAALSVYFGGGTPSLMPAATVAAVIDRVAHHWPAADVEITLEANPTSAEAARFADYRAAGVTRLSLGVQALDDAALAFLGRRHTAAEALAALEMALGCFDRVNVDLIYARPGQSVTSWRQELDRAIGLGPGHLSLYQLTVEPGTAFERQQARGRFRLPADDLAADLYAVTQACTEAAGLPAYEVSNHAAPGHRSRHNLTIWQAGAYVGVGPGAHGRLPGPDGGVAHVQLRRPADWLEAVERHGHGTDAATPLDPDERAAEAVMLGLRTTDGLSRRLFKANTGRALADVLDPAAVADLVASGHLLQTADGLTATPAGRAVLDSVTGRLLA